MAARRSDRAAEGASRSRLANGTRNGTPRLLEDVAAEVRAAQREAERKGTLTSASIDFPQDVRTMFDDVFEEMPWHLEEQQQAMVDELEAKRRWPS